ncbi:MAG TPA: histidine--tRNA ligase, partial [Candidatus Limnocylindria bacterium]|nr:histidine--tRNA ligase [Candidatus Limnocylindria bacterium]
VQARALRYGYPRISTPILENREVFVKGVGEGSDIVGYEMYEVGQRGEGGLTLRPEGTAAVVRALLENGLHKSPQPIRFFYYEPMFRGQRPQLLRFRQFWQWGLECFGAPEAAADVEIIDFANGLFAELGFTDFELEINTIGDESCQGKLRTALGEYFSKHREALSAQSQRRLDTDVLRILDSKEPQDREVIAGAPKLSGILCDDDKKHFAEVRDGLTRLGIAHRVVDTLVRGLDYYTRTVSEFVLTDPEFRKSGDIAVAAGGRYDGLVRRMGGPDLSGTGIAGGVDVLYYALKQQGVKVAEEPKPEVYVVSAQPDDVADRTQLANPLRDAGFHVAIDYSARPLERQLESAIKHGARVAVIRGTPEARGGHVIVRDLMKREQRVTRLAAVVVEVGRHVPKHPRPTLWKPPSNPDDDEPGAAGEGPYLRDRS